MKLFSITSAMKNGTNIISKEIQLMVENGTIKLIFEKCLEMKSSFVLGLKLKPKTSKFVGYAGESKDESKRIAWAARTCI